MEWLPKEVSFDPSKKPDGKWATTLYWGHCETLNTRNRKLIVMSVEDIKKVRADRRLCRYFSMKERFTLQGLPAKWALLLGVNAAVEGTGKAIHAPTFASIIMPALRQIEHSGVVRQRILEEADNLNEFESEMEAAFGANRPNIMEKPVDKPKKHTLDRPGAAARGIRKRARITTKDGLTKSSDTYA